LIQLDERVRGDCRNRYRYVLQAFQPFLGRNDYLLEIRVGAGRARRYVLLSRGAYRVKRQPEHH
jgi:hypothetical protein